MVISAAQTGCLSEVMVITAALSIQDPRERPMEKKQAADEQHRRFEDKDSDFLAFVNLWNYLKEQQDALGSNPFRRMCQKEFLSYLRVREWQDIHFQLRQTVKELGFFKANHESADFKTVHCALLTGLLEPYRQQGSGKTGVSSAPTTATSTSSQPRVCSRSRPSG
ncbi:hypothetical protein ACLK13_07530 [Escherichia coli]